MVKNRAIYRPTEVWAFRNMERTLRLKNTIKKRINYLGYLDLTFHEKQAMELYVLITNSGKYSSRKEIILTVAEMLDVSWQHVYRLLANGGRVCEALELYPRLREKDFVSDKLGDSWFLRNLLL